MAEHKATEKNSDIALPWEFYNYRGWRKSLVKFYTEDHVLLPKEVIDTPIKVLIIAIRDVIDVYGNFPADTARALEYSVNPLYVPGEYYKNVYEPIRKESLSRGDSNLMFMADGLLTIRNFFEKNEEFLDEQFAKEIDQIKAPNRDDKIEKFAETMRSVAKTHVSQIIRMVKDFMKEHNIPEAKEE